MKKIIFVFCAGFLFSGSDFVRQAPSEQDNSLSFIYRLPVSPAITTHSSAWQSGAAIEKPWNDSYWPTFRGILAYRYMNKSSMPSSKAWASYYSYFVANPPETVLNSQNNHKRLAPSEKYDRLIGGASWPLTHYLWRKGGDYFDIYHQVPTWFGICHGWAAASHMKTPLPMSGVTLLSASGESIYFSPTDIRALNSYLWAESSPQAIYIGRKCKFGVDATDPACLDNNPMSWHLAVMHRVGRDGDSMVMDSSRNSEVWNYAIDSYYFRYFNVKTLKTYRSWQEAVIAMDDYRNDPFLSKRGPAARHLLGVIMDVFYPAAIEPRENVSGDRIYQYQSFVYDLELDAALNIVGGEWHTQQRPDFLWTFNYDAQALSPEDALVPPGVLWLPGTPLPAEWSAAALKAAPNGRVLGHIVETLTQLSLSTTGADDNEVDEETPL